MRHELKTWPEFYRSTQDNKKLFELRLDDRNFKVGDELHLREFDPCMYCKGKGKVPGTKWIDDRRSPYMAMPVPDDTSPVDCRDCTGSGGQYTSFSMHYSVTYILRDHPGIRSGYVIMGLYNLASGDAFV